jgi:hypothetical protein
MSVCTCSGRGAVDFKVDTQCSGLCEDVADLRFEVGVKGRAVEAELVLVVLSMLNSGSCKKNGRFPLGQAQKTRLRKPRASCFTCLDVLDLSIARRWSVCAAVALCEEEEEEVVVVEAAKEQVRRTRSCLEYRW